MVHQGNSLQDLASSCKMICKQMRNTIFDLKNLSSAVALQKTRRRISTVNVSSSSRPDRQKEKDDTAIIMVLICYYMLLYDHIYTYGDDMVINGIIIMIFWLVVWNMNGLWLPIQLGISWSQLANSYFSGFKPPMLRLSNSWIQMAETCLYQTTIWLFNIAMENHLFLIGKPLKWAISHGYVK